MLRACAYGRRQLLSIFRKLLLLSPPNALSISNLLRLFLRIFALTLRPNKKTKKSDSIMTAQSLISNITPHLRWGILQMRGWIKWGEKVKKTCDAFCQKADVEVLLMRRKLEFLKNWELKMKELFSDIKERKKKYWKLFHQTPQFIQGLFPPKFWLKPISANRRPKSRLEP